MDIPESDTEFTEQAVFKVDGDIEGGWSVTGEEGWSIVIDASSPIEPRVGMVMRQYGRGVGYIVRGITLDGIVVRYRSPEQQAAEDEQRSREYEAKRALIALEPRNPEIQVPGFEWSEDMREISGFGGGYERTCRAMVSAGCKWLADHPEVAPEFRGYKNIYGVINETNADAEALSKVVTDAAGGDCTGAMHQASISHVLTWRNLGSWPAYQRKMRELAIEDMAESA